ncbi:MAG: acyl-CoA dehydrogenase family protein [Xanthomonadales bacterium]|nr:acyl-CoA dehydrogenase family protein [Xanthomonadales bacterium]
MPERFRVFEVTARGRELQARLQAFMDENVYAAEKVIAAELRDAESRWTVPALIEELKSKARAQGLWNLFLPDTRYGAGLCHLDYAHLAELMGRSLIAPELFNCSAPDSGNIEALALHASDEQRDRWLQPLLNGEIRSAVAMAEPVVASSDPTNLLTTLSQRDEGYILHGRKWWVSGACDPRCRLILVMALSHPEAPVHQRYSMVLVPTDTHGVNIARSLDVFGYDGAPSGYAEVEFDQVWIPEDSILGKPGKAFEVAQGRLGPGRVHQCMNLIGLAQRAYEAMLKRASDRVVFGRPITQHGMAQEALARSRCELEQARLLTHAAAATLDRRGIRLAREHLAMIKVAVPEMACTVIDRAIQIHGALGLSQDSFLAAAYAQARAARIADGPDQVHMSSLARLLS